MLFGLKEFSFDDSDNPIVNDYFHGTIETIMATWSPGQR